MTKRQRKRRRRRPGLLFLLLALLLWGNLRVRPTEYRLSFADLPQAFDGLRILQLSDLHGRRFLSRQILKQAKQSRPDLIAITGDLVDGDGQLAELRELLLGLKALAPLYYVSGNHEWADCDTEPLLRELEALGITVLRNSFVALERKGSRLLLAGVEDPNGYADQKTPAQLAAELKQAGGFSVLLSHRPEPFSDYAALGFRLVLSGHIHGGLVRIPGIGGLCAPGGSLFPRYDIGLYAQDESVMVLSGGLAGVAFLPRICNPPELPLVILEAT